MKTFLLIIFPIFITNIVWSTNYYCDPSNGDMNNNGSLASPWTTLEAVFNQGITFSGGDQIFLLNGNHGFPKISGLNSSNVEIKPLSGHSPTLERIRVGNVANASNWVLNNLTIQSENISQYPINLIDLYPNSSNITVNNCIITSNSVTSTWNRNDWRTKTNNGILAKGTGHVFSNNSITNIAIGITMSSSSSQFTNNIIQYFTIDGIRALGNDCSYIENSILDNISVYYYSENHYDGFQSYSCCPVGNAIVNNVTIRQNTIINCTDNTRQFRGSMQGIGCFDGMYNNWTIENNIIIVDNWHGITLSGATNCRIANNTVIDPYDVSFQDPNDPQQFGNVGPAYIRITAHKTDGGIYNGVLSTNNTIINNLVPTLANDPNIGTVSNNILLGASSNYSNFFVNYNIYDLHLKPTATAIDAGTNTNAPTIDIEGGLRPQGNSTDVGAYEYGTCNTSFSITPPSQTSICSGESITLTTDANVTATWNNGVIDNIPFIPATTQTYTASVGTGNCLTTHQITISVNSTPSFTPSADKNSVCQGDAITLTTDASTTATWNYNVVDNVAFIPPHPQTYTATVTNGNCSHSEQIAINVSAIPSLSTTVSSSSICEGNTVTLNATTDGMNMSWNNGVLDNVPFSPQNTRTYTVTANNFGCVVKDSIRIIVNQLPNISISQNGNQLTANNSNGNLQWFLNNIPINGANLASYTATSNGNYTVSIVDNNDCEGTSNTVTVQDVAIKENTFTDFTIYPNPADSYFKILTNLTFVNIQVYSIEGKLISKSSNNEIDVSKLTSGVYFVKVVTANSFGIKKVVIK